jgi:hypothetical protein
VCCDEQFSCLIIGLFSTLFIYKVRISVHLIELIQFLIVIFHGESPMEEEMFLVDSYTINSILRETKYFQTLNRRSENVLTIAVRDATIVGSGRFTIMFLNGTQVTIDDALLYPDSTRTLISFRDIWKNGLHICTHEDNKEEFPLITKCFRYDHEVLERIHYTPSGLYYIYIKSVPHVELKVIFRMLIHSRSGIHT